MNKLIETKRGNSKIMDRFVSRHMINEDNFDRFFRGDGAMMGETTYIVTQCDDCGFLIGYKLDEREEYIDTDSIYHSEICGSCENGWMIAVAFGEAND